MFQKIKIALSVCVMLTALGSCTDVRIVEHKDWKSVFDKYNVTDGCFEYYDNNKEIANYYNKERCSERFSPASTFKIFNSLVALETGVAQDEQLKIKWDGVVRDRAELNTDLTMEQAFKISSVWYYQEIARRIGAKEMQHYLDTVQYGNKKMGNEITEFWLNDTLQVTPDEQVGFMKRLYHDELPFSQRSQRIVKGMMKQEEAQDYKLYYKTGLSRAKNGQKIVWIVGFAESVHRLKNPKTQEIQPIPHPYFFALNYAVPENTPNVTTTRIDILHELLTKAGIHKY